MRHFAVPGWPHIQESPTFAWRDWLIYENESWPVTGVFVIDYNIARMRMLVFNGGKNKLIFTDQWYWLSKKSITGSLHLRYFGVKHAGIDPIRGAVVFECAMLREYGHRDTGLYCFHFFQKIHTANMLSINGFVEDTVSRAMSNNNSGIGGN